MARGSTLWNEWRAGVFHSNTLTTALHPISTQRSLSSSNMARLAMPLIFHVGAANYVYFGSQIITDLTQGLSELL